MLVANKIDLADKDELELFYSLADTFQLQKKLLTTTQHGVLNIEWLDYPHTPRFQQSTFSQATDPQSEQWQTHSVRYSSDALFDLDTLKIWIEKQSFIRLKGLVQTKSGCFLLNCSHEQVNIRQHENTVDNYIEVIDKILDIAELEKTIKQYCFLKF